MVPRAFNQVLSLAVHLTIQAADLAEQLADQFAARDITQLPAAPPPAALQCPASCHHPGWIAVQMPASLHVVYSAGCRQTSPWSTVPAACKLPRGLLCRLPALPH
ncbi:hypothetical protein MTO96_027911 [Rhipicephalus appendiculatus]